MSARGPYRRHSPQFKVQLCTDIRSGKLGRREAQKTYQTSANLIQLWLTQYDRGELDTEEAAAVTIAEYEAKIAALERKVGQLTMELDLVKNTAPADRQQQRAILACQRPATISIRRGCQVILFPRSTYYYRSIASAVALSDDRLLGLIGDIQDEFPGYGYRRVTLELRARGHVVNYKRTARLMKEQGLGVKPRCHFARAPTAENDLAVFPNLYRNVIPALPDKVWVADITFIRIASSFVFLTVILDACSRRVVGYAISRRIDTELTLAALKAAMQARHPPPGTASTIPTVVASTPVLATVRHCKHMG